MNTSSNLGLRTAAVVLALGFAVSAAAPAGAATNRGADPSRDVIKVDTSTGEQSPAPRFKGVDVTYFATAYGRRVRLALTVRDLGKHIAVQYRIGTGNGTYRAYLEHDFGTNFTGLSKNDKAVCDGKTRGAFNTASDVVTLSFPARCLAKPAWIRTGAVTTTADENATWLDDARRKSDADANHITLGPRVRRG